jgi:hypothetical protein
MQDKKIVYSLILQFTKLSNYFIITDTRLCIYHDRIFNTKYT